MILSGNRVRIRGIEREDLKFLMEIINDPNMEMMENGFNYPISMASQEMWFEDFLNAGNNDRFIIENYEHERIGYTSLLNIDWKNRKAHTGIKLYGENVIGKGYGTDSVLTIMRFAFEELQLHRLEGFILDYNVRSQKLYLERCGWKKEGIQRKAVFKGGEYHDLVLVACLKSDYDQLMRSLDLKNI